MTRVTFLSRVDVNIDAVVAALAPRAVTAACSRRDLEEAIADTEVLVVQNQGFTPCLIDAQILARAQNLRLIQHHGVATDTTDLDAARTRGIPVATIPGQNSRSVAEHAFHLLLALARRAHAAQALLRDGRLGELVCDELGGKTLCILGTGSIGQHVARMAGGFDMRVIGVRRDPSAGPAAGFDEVVGTNALHDVLARSQAVVIALPLTPSTRDIIDADALAAMPEGALVVNVSRGGHVNRAALEAALASGRPGGYATDAWWTEPAAADDPLLTDPRVLATPHIGGKSRDAIRRSALAVLANIERLEKGEPLDSVVGLPVRREEKAGFVK